MAEDGGDGANLSDDESVVEAPGAIEQAMIQGGVKYASKDGTDSDDSAETPASSSVGQASNE